MEWNGKLKQMKKKGWEGKEWSTGHKERREWKGMEWKMKI